MNSYKSTSDEYNTKEFKFINVNDLMQKNHIATPRLLIKKHLKNQHFNRHSVNFRFLIFF